jgi:hypothetical protein
MIIKIAILIIIFIVICILFILKDELIYDNSRVDRSVYDNSRTDRLQGPVGQGQEKRQIGPTYGHGFQKQIYGQM